MTEILNISFKHITLPVVIIFGVFGLLFGFFTGLQKFTKEKAKFNKLKKEVGAEKIYISTLKEKASELLKTNIELGGQGVQE